MDYHIMNNLYIAVLSDEVGEVSQALIPGLGSLVSAVVILIAGIILASWLGRIVTDLTRRIGFDELFERAGVKKFIGRRDAKFLISSLLGWVVKWFVLLFVVTLAVDALGLPEVTQFMVQILNYIPNLIAAVFILTLGLIISELVYEALHGMSEASGYRVYRLVGMGARLLVITITVLIVLEQIGIQTTILYIFAGGFALMIGLAGGIAFGLGGQEQARQILDQAREKAEEAEEGMEKNRK